MDSTAPTLPTNPKPLLCLSNSLISHLGAEFTMYCGSATLFKVGREYYGSAENIFMVDKGHHDSIRHPCSIILWRALRCALRVIPRSSVRTARYEGGLSFEAFGSPSLGATLSQLGLPWNPPMTLQKGNLLHLFCLLLKVVKGFDNLADERVCWL